MVLPRSVSLVCWFLKGTVRFVLRCLLAVAVVLILLFLYCVSFLVDIVGCKLKNVRARFRCSPLPVVDVWPGWDLIPTIQPAIGETFERVIICDTNRFDDPLYPHVSIIYIIGVTTHASYWRKFTIWRVSTVTGRREYVSHFNWIDPFPIIPLDIIYLWMEVIGFYSQNVVFIHAMFNRGFGLYCYLFVYDIRHKKWAKYNLAYPLAIESFYPTAILCLDRKMKRGTVDGWRIRFLAARLWYGIMFTNFTIDLSASDPNSSAIITRENLLFPYTSYGEYRPSGNNVRTEHQFGLVQRVGNLPNKVFVYHAKLNRFQEFQNFHEFTDSDATLSNMRQRSISMHNGLDPMVFNDREVIEVNKPNRRVIQEDVDYTQSVMRVWVQPPTLRMAAAQSAFKNIPALATMTADQFRQATGVNLAGHLP